MNFSELFPKTIFDAAEQQGYDPTGFLSPLNSYENRVYEIAVEEAPSIIVKFYRPARWSLETLVDEHRFLKSLEEKEIPVINSLPLRHPVAESEHLGITEEGIYYAISPWTRAC